MTMRSLINPLLLEAQNSRITEWTIQKLIEGCTPAYASDPPKPSLVRFTLTCCQQHVNTSKEFSVKFRIAHNDEPHFIVSSISKQQGMGDLEDALATLV